MKEEFVCNMNNILQFQRISLCFFKNCLFFYLLQTLNVQRLGLTKIHENVTCHFQTRGLTQHML